MTDRDRDAAILTLQVAGLQERIEELQLELATCRRENAALRLELCEFAAAVARERQPTHSHDDDRTVADAPRARAAREKTTVPIPPETMAQMIDGGRR